MKIFFFGIAIMLIALWGGSYTFYNIPDWGKFPTLVTAFMGFSFGIIVVGLGIQEIITGDK